MISVDSNAKSQAINISTVDVSKAVAFADGYAEGNASDPYLEVSVGILVNNTLTVWAKHDDAAAMPRNVHIFWQVVEFY